MKQIDFTPHISTLKIDGYDFSGLVATTTDYDVDLKKDGDIYILKICVSTYTDAYNRNSIEFEGDCTHIFDAFGIEPNMDELLGRVNHAAIFMSEILNTMLVAKTNAVLQRVHQPVPNQTMISDKLTHLLHSL